MRRSASHLRRWLLGCGLLLVHLSAVHGAESTALRWIRPRGWLLAE
jgi:hypothetical protein